MLTNIILTADTWASCCGSLSLQHKAGHGSRENTPFKIDFGNRKHLSCVFCWPELISDCFYILGQLLQNRFSMFPLGWIKRSAGTERTLSSDAWRWTHLHSDTLMVVNDGAESFPLFTRQILTLATLNLHYGGVHRSCPWLWVLPLCQICLLPGGRRVGAWAWSRIPVHSESG